ncbi:hypothetical protein MD484_g5, partial [Candolleomyces efflorescens]
MAAGDLNGVPLTLSDDAAIETILTDIPLFCIGVLAIAAFTILLALKRVDQLSVFFFISSFLGFIAAILDLGQLLIRGHSNAANGLMLDDVSGFINAREALLALSIGAIFLFWWKFSGRRPFAIKPVGPFNFSMHCASWQRWGYIGFLLKWTSLVVCIVVLILQVIWRLAPKHHLYGSLYVATATLETTISIIFILKLFLNVYLCPASSKTQVLLDYVTPALALLINAGLGVGNLVLFSFSETALGRFLRAIEVYIIIVYYLIMTFRTTQAPSQHKPTSSIEKLPVAFETSNAGNTNTLTLENPLQTATPRPGFVASNLLRPWRQDDRGSVLSRVSSWLTSGRLSQLRPSKQGSAESSDKEMGIPAQTTRAGSRLSDATTASTLEKNRNALYGSLSSSRDSDLLKPAPAFVDDGERPLTEISLSYYAMERDIRTSSRSMVIQDRSTISSDSPVYGLDGIIPPRREPSMEIVVVKPPTVAGGSRGLSPIDQLFQEQSELDRSITKLRGLHERENGGTKTELNEDGQLITVPRDEVRNTMSPSSLSKPSSASGRSDFSLSIFPEPPAPELRASSPLPSARLRRITPRLKDPRIGLVPLQIPGLDPVSEPGTPSRTEEPLRFNSAGTQYEITSFIGDLTGPDGGGYPLSGFTANLASSDLFPSAPVNSREGNFQPSSGTSTLPESVREDTPPSPSSSPPPRPAVPIGVARSPSTPSTATTPTLSRGLGSATMSSSFKAQTTPLQRSGEVSPITPRSLNRQPSGGLRGPSLRKVASTNRMGPTGPTHFKSNSASQTQGGEAIIPF